MKKNKNKMKRDAEYIRFNGSGYKLELSFTGKTV